MMHYPFSEKLRIPFKSTTPAYLSSARSIIGVLFLGLCLAAPLIANAGRGAIKIDETEVLLSEARSKFKEGRIPEAINLYRRVAERLPNEPGVRKELAYLLSNRMETRNEAEKVYAEACLLAPNDADLALERAANLAFLGDHVSASMEYRRAFELKPGSEAALAGYILQITRLGSSPIAISRISEKLTKEPGDIASRLMLAELLRNDGRYNDALEQYSMVHQKDPQNAIARHGMAEAWLSLGFYNRAKEAFKEADMGSAQGRVLANQARALLASDQVEAALNLLDTNVADVDKEPLALIVLSDTYRFLKKPAREHETLERLIKLFPASTHISAFERLARTRFEMGDKAGSIRACRQILSYDPQNSVGALGLVLNGETLGSSSVKGTTMTPARQAAKDQAEAEAAIFWNQSETAIGALRKALLVRENGQRLLLALGYEWLRKGNADEALKVFAQVAMSSGKQPGALFGMAQAESLRGKPQRALDIYVDVLRVDPTNIRALAGQGECVLRLGNMEGAALLLNDLHKRAPESNFIRDLFLKTLESLGRSFKSDPIGTRGSTDYGTSKDNHLPSSPYALINPILKAGDVIRISFAGKRGQSSEIRIGSEGTIALPFLSRPLHAECLTEHELSTSIANQGVPQLAGVTPTVNITEFQRASLLVSGAVYLPGRFNIRKTLGLNEALMLASGANPRAGRTVYVVRGADSCGAEPQERIVNVVESYERSEIENGSLSVTVPLRTGDAVIVPEKDSIFIFGEVVRPGSIISNNGVRLFETLQQRGGLLAGARSDHIILSRLMPNGKPRKRFLVSLDDIKLNRLGDVILQPGDVVEVPSLNKGRLEHSFARVLLRATLDATQTKMPTSSQVSVRSQP